VITSWRDAVRSAVRGLAVVAALAVAACGTAAPPAAPRPTASASPVPSAPSPVPSAPPTPAAQPGEPRTLVTGLAVPWGVAFLPDRSALVTERGSARLLRVAPDGAVTPLGVVAGVVAQGEGGLMGVAVSPRYDTDRAVFVAYTSATDNRVVRLQVGADGTVDGAAQQVIVSGIPKARIHNGGGLAFGPDGFLYVATGDAGRREPAQDRADLGGKILRVTADGAAAPGNQFGTAVYSLGHRNVQGLAFTPDGRLYATEFGQNRVDEVNLSTAGANYGWPEVEGVGGRPGFTDPVVIWSTDEASPSGLAAAGGALWAAALRGERLWRVPLVAGGTGEPEALLTGEFGRLRGVAATRDGAALWVTTSNRDGRGTPGPDDDRILVIPLA
jgi:glucose/arabinose dehydrogenase